MVAFLPPEITAAGTTILPHRFKLYHYRTGDIVACNSKGTDLGFVMSAITNRLMLALRDRTLVARS
jgi:hypothetical protein